MKALIIFSKLFQFVGILSLLILFYYSIKYGIWWLIFSFIYYKIVVGLFGNQIAQHRYFSHKSFITNRYNHKFLVWISLTTGTNLVMYASLHRHHHTYSDTNDDIHSPNQSILKSLITWSTDSTTLKKVRPAVDLMKDPDIIFVNKYGYYFLLGLIFFLSILNWKLGIFIVLAGIGWNYLHMNLFRTTLVHLNLPASYRNFATGDQSWNNKFIQMLDIGEGLHNNHHMYPNLYNQAILPNEFDPAAWVIKNFFEKNNNK